MYTFIYLPDDGMWSVGPEYFKQLKEYFESCTQKLVLFNHFNILSVYNKSNIYDMNGLYYSYTQEQLTLDDILVDDVELQFTKQKIDLFYRTHPTNTIPPITILSEYYYKLFLSLTDTFDLIENEVSTAEYTSYLKRKNVFQTLNTDGISINKNLIDAVLSDEESVTEIKDTQAFRLMNTLQYESSIIHPKYYFSRTPVGRIMSSYKKINMLALNKKDLSRCLFNSRFENGKLVYFDFDGMHLRLFSNLIGFDIPLDVPAHKFMTGYLSGVDYETLSDEAIKIGKRKTWQYMYGYEHDDIEFCQLADEFKRTKLSKAVTPLGRFVHDNIDESKKLNYHMQKYEVDYITIALQKIIDYITANNLEMKVVLYEYDGLMFDIPKHEFGEAGVLKQILETTLDEYQMKVRMFSGTNYSDMNFVIF
jgi:hypothetical protein